MVNVERGEISPVPNFFPLPTAKELGVKSRQYLEPSLRRLRIEHTDWVKPVYKDRAKKPRIHVTEEGLAFLKECLSVPPIPKEFSAIPTRALAREFEVSEELVRAKIRQLKKTSGEELVKRSVGDRGGPNFATPSGMELLRQLLKENSNRWSREGYLKAYSISKNPPLVSKPQEGMDQPPNKDSLVKNIPSFSTLPEGMQQSISCLDQLEDVSLREKRILFITSLWYEDSSPAMRKIIAKILGISPQEVDRIIMEKRSAEEEDRLEALFAKFSIIEAAARRNRKNGR